MNTVINFISILFILIINLYSQTEFIGTTDSTSLQYLINHTPSGDTLVLTDTSYYENVIITKSITITSSNSDTTKIIGIIDSLPTINIECDNVSLNKLKIIGKDISDSSYVSNEAIKIKNANSITIDNCIVYGGSDVRLSDNWLDFYSGNAINIQTSNTIHIDHSLLKGGNAKYGDNVPVVFYGAHGGQGVIVSNSEELRIQQSEIYGGKGLDVYAQGGDGGCAISILNSNRIQLDNLFIKGGMGGWALYSGSEDGDGGEGLYLENCSSININDCEISSSSGNYGGTAIGLIRIQDSCNIQNCNIIGGFGSIGGLGLFNDSTNISIFGSKITGGNSSYRFSGGGTGLMAVNYSSIKLDQNTILKGGSGLWEGEPFEIDSTSKIETITNIVNNESLFAHEQFIIYPSFPNPFNIMTTFRYYIPFQTNVRIRIYDVTGSLIIEKELYRLSAGYHTYRFNGSSYSSGIYYYQLILDNGISKSSKLILVK